MAAMRRRLVTRSPGVKPNPLLRVVRTMSPSRTSTLKPRCASARASNWARVVFPEALNPINQTQNAPFTAAGGSGTSPDELCKPMSLTFPGWIKPLVLAAATGINPTGQGAGFEAQFPEA